MKKKFALLTMVLVMCLAAVGIGYANWSDTIDITGTVDTGNVDLVIEGLSGTEVYKMADDTLLERYYLTDEGGVLIHESVMAPDPATSELIASAKAELGQVDDSIVMTFDNLFPSICFMADAKFHYDGSIPVKISAIDITLSAWIEGLVTSGDADAALFRWNPETMEPGECVDVGTQLHYCDWLVLVVWVHVPQDDTLMSLTGAASCTITVTQWNEVQ